MIKNINKFSTALIVFAILVSFVFYMADKKEKDLFSNKSLTTATVTKVEIQRNSSGIFIRYKFRAKAINYIGLTRIEAGARTENAKYLRSILIGKQFPMIFDSLAPRNSKLLLEKKEYAKFNIKRPDNLSRYFEIIDSIGHVID